jgi:serine/threonine protein kinase
MDYTIDYTINKTRLLGRGITSEVYLGFNNKTMEKVAVKIIPKKIKNIKFYVENEISNLRILNFSPNIIQLIDHYETKSEYILIFEYIELTLKQYIKIGITDKIKIDILLQLITIAEVLRKNNIVHHDIKPDNILVQVNGETNKVNGETNEIKIKLCDFGMSILVGKSSHNKLCGSPIYMHPSKLLYNYNFNSDEWSMNVIFYEIVYGKNPYKGTTTQTELVQNIYKNHIKFPDYNIFTPILQRLFNSSGNVFITAIKKNIEQLEIDLTDKQIEKEYVFV